MLSLFIRNFIFTVLQPGMVAGFIPWLILRGRTHLFSSPFKWHHFAGIILCFIGFYILISCIVSFALKGKGTLSPADPTKKLVTTGLYKYSRNPMYTGVMLILIGEALFFVSLKLFFYSAFIFIAFYFFITRFEEPRLKKDFGKEYDDYCKKTGRFIF